MHSRDIAILLWFNIVHYSNSNFYVSTMVPNLIEIYRQSQTPNTLDLVTTKRLTRYCTNVTRS